MLLLTLRRQGAKRRNNFVSSTFLCALAPWRENILAYAPEHMPRAGWKQNRLLELIAKHSSVSHPLVTSTIAMAGDQWHWGEVHSQFRHVLRETLKLDEIKTKSVEEEELVYVLALTEQVAKVIYNATNPDDEFDEDSAAWIVAMFRGFVATSETRTSR